MTSKSSLLALLLSLLLSLPLLAMQTTEETFTKNSIIRTIIIDPGHGGKDYPGAVGQGGLLEKDVVLSIAKKLKKLILAEQLFLNDNVRVVLTRDRDIPLTLEERAEIANTNNGDVFISIHTNGFGMASAWGAETYFLGLHASDEHARKVAEMENESYNTKSIAPAKASQTNDIKLILFDYIHKQYIAESNFLAEHIQAELNNSINNNRNRGVRQSGFGVLRGVAMAAVLVEVDFITNPERERLLADDTYQWRFAQSMLDALKTYKEVKERGQTITSSGDDR